MSITFEKSDKLFQILFCYYPNIWNTFEQKSYHHEELKITIFKLQIIFSWRKKGYE